MTTIVAERTVTSKELVERIPGLTYRMLDYWIRRGYVTPAIPAEGSGTRRRFTQAQVDQLESVVNLREQLNGYTLWPRVLRGEVNVTIEEVTS